MWARPHPTAPAERSTTPAGSAKGPRVGAAAALAAFCACAALTLPLARAAALLVATGGLPGLFAVLSLSVLLSAPAGFWAGVFSAELLSGTPEDSTAFYIFEAAGACAAGLLQAFVLAGRVRAADAVCGGAALLLVFGASFGLLRGSRRSAALYLMALSLVGGAWSQDARSRQWRYRGLRVEKEVETPYGRDAVAALGDRKVFLEDGFVTADYPDDAAQEELAHLPLLAHPKPGRVLVLGVPGLLAAGQILGHRPELLEYADPDAARSTLALSLLPAALRVRVVVRTEDPRRLLRASPGVYDVIFQTVPEPVNAGANRLFTDGFFREARAALRPGGLLAFSLPSSETYLAPEEAYLAACVLKTAREAFPASALVPGRRMLVLLSEKPFELTPEALGRRWERRGLKARALVPGVLPVLLHPERRAWLERSLAGVRAVAVNRDLFPLAYFHAWRVWLSKFVSPGYLLGLAALALALLWALGRLWALRGDWLDKPALAFVFALGFWGMATECALALLAQSALGNLHRVMGAVFAAFMLGAALGSAAGRRMKGAWGGVVLLAAAAACSAALARAAGTLSLLEGGSGLTVFLLLQGGAGLLVGAAFPVALARGEAPAAELYGNDLWGASLGGLLAAAVFIPLFGFRWTLVVAALPCVPAVFLELLRRRK